MEQIEQSLKLSSCRNLNKNYKDLNFIDLYKHLEILIAEIQVHPRQYMAIDLSTVFCYVYKRQNEIYYYIRQ